MVLRSHASASQVHSRCIRHNLYISTTIEFTEKWRKKIEENLTYLPRRWCPQEAGAVRAAGRTGPPLARELALILKQ